MPDAERGFALVTFDVYAALFDFAGSLRAPVADALGPSAPVDDLIATWRGAQLALAQASNSLAGPRIAFRDATRLGLDHALAKHGRSASTTARAALVAAWDAIEPWPEAGAALEQLKAAGRTIALLSNGDRDMLDALAARLPVAMDHVFSSQEAGVYKPHPDIYALPLRRLGLAPAQVLHVAGSAMDVLGAKRAGLACAWSNRRGEPPLVAADRPDHTIADLSGLAAIA